jgi:glutamine synthetase
MIQQNTTLPPQTNGIAKTSTTPTLENISEILSHDDKVKVAGIDCDGQLRGKIMSKDKFLSSVEKGFGMSSAIFGWDMHDELYTNETRISSSQEGYADFIAIPDLSSYRRLPWEDDLPFFLLHFVARGEPVCADGRNMLRNLTKGLEEKGWKCLAGGMQSTYSTVRDIG